MWKRPQAWMGVAREMEKAMGRFHEKWSREDPVWTKEIMSDAEKAQRREVDKAHRSMMARLDFYQVKLTGLENYIFTTLERLKVQREAVSREEVLERTEQEFVMLTM
jgi:hypothetical protein